MDDRPSLDEQFEMIRRSNERRKRVLQAVVGLIAAASVVLGLRDALGGSGPAVSRVILGLLGVGAAIALQLRAGLGWPLAVAWAAIQVPYYAWTPDGGSPTAQALSFPLTSTDSMTRNGVLVRYSSVGINLVGAILTVWLVRWREMFLPRKTAASL